jgi:hypothetical protein
MTRAGSSALLRRSSAGHGRMHGRALLLQSCVTDNGRTPTLSDNGSPRRKRCYDPCAHLLARARRRWPGGASPACWRGAPRQR